MQYKSYCRDGRSSGLNTEGDAVVVVSTPKGTAVVVVSTPKGTAVVVVSIPKCAKTSQHVDDVSTSAGHQRSLPTASRSRDFRTFVVRDVNRHRS